MSTSYELSKARDAVARASRVAVLSGAGVSAESGVPTFRGAGGLWRRFAATELASPEAWRADPGLVWEFYDYRRRVMLDKLPNAGHRALAAFQARLAEEGRAFSLITQNVDGLHEAGGSREVVHLHGSLWRTRCVACGLEQDNHDVPITPAFEGAGDPSPEAHARRFSEADLPHCGCGGVVRPAIVWFGESLDERDLSAAFTAASAAEVFLVVGTSAVVYPAASLIPQAKRAGAFVIEVNLEATSATALVDVHLAGPSGEVLPLLLVA
jgi:NAD-dependent deacetylase sirtuin 5